MKNKGKIFTFVAGAIVGVIGFLVLGVAAMFLFKDKLIELKEGYLLAPPIPAMLKANYTWEVISSKGERKSLATLKDKVAIVHLFSPDCTNCLAEWPTIVSLYEKTQDLGVPIICIAIAKTEELSDFVAQHNPPFPVYAKTDPTPEIFALTNAPVTFIYDKQGNIAFKHVGSAKWDDDSVVQYLKQLSQGETNPAAIVAPAEASKPATPAPPVAEVKAPPAIALPTEEAKPKTIEADTAVDNSKSPYVDPATLEGVALDNDKATFTGDWTRESNIGPFVGMDYMRAKVGSGAMAVYAPKIPKKQHYKLLISYSAAVDCSSNTYVRVQAADGSHLLNVEQRTYPDVVGPFAEIGVFEFDTTGTLVEIRTDGVEGFVVADAVQLIPVDSPAT